MAFHNLPELGPMLMSGAAAYSQSMLRLATDAARSVKHELDIPYGSDLFQQLDVWRPANAPSGGLPVIVLIHGGAFRNGHKEWMGAHAPTITSLPAVLVSPNYRLVPRVRLPDCVVDCFEALAWVHRNIARYGGDSRRIHVGGHSAGGHLAAMLALDQASLRRGGVPPDAIRSCLPMSAVFSLIKSELPAQSFMHRLYSEMFAAEADAVPVTPYTHAVGNTVPFFVTWGERDAAELIPDNERMTALARKQGFLEGSHVYAGADHFGAHLACLDDDGPWMTAVRGVAARTRAPPSARENSTAPK